MKKIEILALATIMMLPRITLSSEIRNYNGFEYKILSEEVKILRYTRGSSRVKIPEKIKNFPVTILDRDTFKARGEDSPEEVFIPSSVKCIEPGIFNFCWKLESIEVDDKNPYFCSQDGILFNKEKTALLRFPHQHKDSKYRIPNSVTEIGEAAFYACDELEVVYFPDKLTKIGFRGFQHCGSLNEIELPASVRFIEGVAFHKCEYLEKIRFHGNAPHMGRNVFKDTNQRCKLYINETAKGFDSAKWEDYIIERLK